jgi:hypothetical protein
MLELLLANQKKTKGDQARMKTKIGANRESDPEELDGMINANLKDLKEDIKSSKAEMRSIICAFRSELEEIIQHEMKDFLSYVDQKTQNLRRELTETIEITQRERQRVEVSLDKRTRDVEEKIASIKEDITSNKRKFQSQLEEFKTVAERGSRPTVGTNAAQPPTFNGNTSWSPSQRQFGIVAEHNRWSDRKKSTYLITALKGCAADVLPGIPTNTTYEDSLQALEDRFGDQHFAAAYRCQLTRTQKAGEFLQDFATDLLTDRAYPTLP